MDASWTLPELVEEVAARIAALPAPANGQVRAVPDDRTIRYYGTIGLLDRPVAMRGRTALYGQRHLAQVIAIKRLQGSGKSLAEIHALWATLTDDTLARMSGVALTTKGATRGKDFWRSHPTTGSSAISAPSPARPLPARPRAEPPMELRIALAPGAVLTLAIDPEHPLTAAAIRAIRAAAEPLITELAGRPLALSHSEPDPEPGDAR